MPKLSRLYFLNIGHSNARMQDLRLELCDPDGQALDSILWLRNGGGKSSLLTLFFSLLNPNRRSFLGTRAEQGDRTLEDYVLPDDQAVVLAQWQLDTAPHQPEQWFWTGGFYQWRNDKLERVFFSAQAQAPLLQFTDFPFWDESGKRLTLRGFKQAWQNLLSTNPQLNGHEFENHQEWRQALEREARIDSELFLYQQRMNTREGSADELFRFKDMDQFVDFFLELTVPSERGVALARNLSQFQTGLRERLEEFQPSLELIDRLILTLQPMRALAFQRLENRRLLGELKIHLQALATHIISRVLSNTQRLSLTSSLESQARQDLLTAQTSEQQQHARMLMLQRHALVQRQRQCKALHDALTVDQKKAERLRLIWKAAIPFVELQRCHASIQELNELFTQQQRKLAPDIKAVQVAARQLSEALGARAQTTRLLAVEKSKQAEKIQLEANQTQAAAIQAREQAVRANVNAEALTKQLEQFNASQSKLQATDTLEPTEGILVALERWQGAVAQHEFEIEAISGEMVQQRSEQSLLEQQFNDTKQQTLEVATQETNLTQQLSLARAARETLEQHPMLARALEFELIDASVLNNITLGKLRDHRSNAESRMREIKASLINHADALQHLETHKRLPPTRDLRTVLRVLESHEVQASAGWTHLSQVVPRDQARAFIARHPELMQGVLIRDAHFEKAKVALENMADRLDSPVVIARRTDAFNANADEAVFAARAAQRFVVGPSSDAHFDPEAAEREHQEREIQARRERLRHETIEQESLQWRDTADLLERFLEQYPEAWFTTQETELLMVQKHHKACTERLGELTLKRQVVANRIQSLEQQRDHLQQAFNTAKDHVRRLESHIEQHGTDEAEQKRQQALVEQMQRAKDQSEAAKRFEATKETLVNQVRTLEDAAQGLTRAAEDDERERKNLKYLEGEPPEPVAGHVDQLRDTYKRLSEHLETKNQGNKLQIELQNAQNARDKASKHYEYERDQNIEEHEIRAALGTIADHSQSSISTKLEEAVQHGFALQTQLGSSHVQLQIAENELSQHERNHVVDLKLPAHELELEVDALNQLASKAQTAITTAQAQAQTAQAQIQQYTELKQHLQSQQDKLKGLQSSLNVLLEDHQEALSDVLQPDQSTWVAPLDEELERLYRDLEKTLKKAARDRTDLLEKRTAIHQQYMQCLIGFNFGFVTPLSAWQPENLETEIDTLLHDLEVRAQTIRNALVESEHHRNLIIEETSQVAEVGIKMLADLQRHSKLDHVPASGSLAGHRFLRIQMSVTDSPRDQRERIGTLIDDITREGLRLDGLKLIQRAVRKLAQPFRVEVLFPDTDAEARYIPITSMAKESGGERLTSAVLLYCALAQQRVKARGQKNSSSTLLLDNPVGTVSRAKFLELQRAAAQTMNIQLIYATGVNDLEALRTMPNIVRLRNERRSGNDHLLEAARMIRPDPTQGENT